MRLDIGHYLFTLAIGHKIQLYPALTEAFGVENGNAFMDYTQYMLRERRDDIFHFDYAMSESYLFSSSNHEAGWYNSFFDRNLGSESREKFFDVWTQRLLMQGIKDIWLLLDVYDQNNNHQIQVTAVSATNGMPVGMDLLTANSIRAGALSTLRNTYVKKGFQVQGVMLPQPLFQPYIVDAINAEGLAFVAGAGAGDYACRSARREIGGDIHGQMKYAIDRGGIYAFSTHTAVPIFEKGGPQGYVTLLYDGRLAPNQEIALTDKLYEAYMRAQKLIELNRPITLPSEIEPYFRVLETGKERAIAYNQTAIDEALSLAGFSAIVTNADMSEREARNLFNMGESVRRLRKMIDHTPLAAGAPAANPDRTANFQLAWYVTMVFLHHEKTTCDRFDKDFLTLANELDRNAFMVVDEEGRCTLTNHLSDEMWAMFSDYGVSRYDADVLIRDIARRERLKGLGIEVGEIYRGTAADVLAENAKHSDDPNYLSDDQIMPGKRGRGRPPGSKNRKSAERKIAIAHGLKPREPRAPVIPVDPNAPKPKRGRGRPPGSKNLPKPQPKLDLDLDTSDDYNLGV